MGRGGRCRNCTGQETRARARVYVCVCARACVCVRAHARALVCACVCVRVRGRERGGDGSTRGLRRSRGGGEVVGRCGEDAMPRGATATAALWRRCAGAPPRPRAATETPTASRRSVPPPALTFSKRPTQGRKRKFESFNSPCENAPCDGVRAIKVCSGFALRLCPPPGYTDTPDLIGFPPHHSRV